VSKQDDAPEDGRAELLEALHDLARREMASGTRHGPSEEAVVVQIFSDAFARANELALEEGLPLDEAVLAKLRRQGLTVGERADEAE
jgi:LDH2 family malate/lactate/ureidoglycolate dehydrogenase